MAIAGVVRVGYAFPNPFEELSEDALILLDDEEPRPFLGRDSRKVIRDGRVEIAVVRARRARIRLQIATEVGDADLFAGVPVGGCFVAEKALFEADLRLGPQIVVHPGEHDDDLVSRVRRLADQSRIVPRLARLDMPHHQASAVPYAVTLWVLHKSQNVVGRFIQSVDDIAGQLLL